MVNNFKVYIIKRESRKSRKITYYVGYSIHPYLRFEQHKKKGCNKRYILHGIKIIAGFNTRKIAMKYEKYLKKQTHFEKDHYYTRL